MDGKVRIPIGLRARTLDFYVAFLVFFIGMSGLIDPTWPERFSGPIYWVVYVEDVYLMIASSVIMSSLLIRHFIKKCTINVLIPTLIGEMFGWLFVSAAAAVIVLTAYWIPPSSVVDIDNPISFWSWILVWIGMGIATFLRYLDLRLHYRNHTE